MISDWFAVALDSGEELDLKPFTWLVYVNDTKVPLNDVMSTGRIAYVPPGPRDDPRSWQYPLLGVVLVHTYLPSGDRMPVADATEMFVSWRDLINFDPLQRFHPIRTLDMSQKA